MSIVVYCKHCGKKIRAPESRVGKKGKCPRCELTMVIPEVSESGPLPEFLDASVPKPETTATNKKDPSLREPSATPTPSPIQPDAENKYTLELPPEPAPSERPTALASKKDQTRPQPQAQTQAQAKPPKQLNKIKLPSSPQSPRPDKPKLQGKVIVKNDTLWDISPDPPPQRLPGFILAGILIFLAVISILVWLSMGAPQLIPPSKETRDREQFQVPEQNDAWKKLKSKTKPEKN